MENTHTLCLRMLIWKSQANSVGASENPIDCRRVWYNHITIEFYIGENSNGESEVDFLSIGGSEVKGEWIETIGKPRFDISYEKDILVVRVAVKGRIREIVSSTIDVKSLVLRNGIEDRFESNSFKSGDDLFVSFQSPTSGYLVVYLIDADQRAFCLLPYQNMESGCFPWKPIKDMYYSL